MEGHERIDAALVTEKMEIIKGSNSDCLKNRGI